MPEAIGPTIQTVTDGRLTLKKSHLEYLGNPASVDVTFGPGRSILIHESSRRKQMVETLLGTDEGPLDSDQSQVEFRLDSMAESVPVDDQGRMRLPAMHLDRAMLTEKGCKAYLVPRRRNGWLEVWNQQEFSRVVDDPTDNWLDSLNKVILRCRGERQSEAR